MKFRTTGNKILFQFLNKAENGMMVDRHAGSIILRASLDSQKNPRWGKVVAVGPDVKSEEIVEGQYIYVEPLQWSIGMPVDLGNGSTEKLWQTDESKIMLVSETEEGLVDL